jgi:ferrous iron transport protein B
MATKEKTLKELNPGQGGVILSVGNQSGAVRRRLVDMGLTPGTAVAVKRIAPFGDPIEIRLRGYELSLRKDDAARIVVDDIPLRRQDKTAGRITYGFRRLDPETLSRIRRAQVSGRDCGAGTSNNGGQGEGMMTIALAGNPNSGKTTLYNAVTGSDQYVGNWPGVTVEKKEGIAGIDGIELKIIDLPGIYSLSPYSMEEIVAQDCILGLSGTRPDAVINVVDVTNIERNLYLTVQLLELERPLVLALSFMDEAGKNGDVIDAGRLSVSLGVPVVPISARTGENIDRLLRTVLGQIRCGYTLEPDDLYDDITHDILRRIERLIRPYAETAGLPAHWSAVKLLEGDMRVLKTLNPDAKSHEAVEALAGEYVHSGGLGDRETRLADCRYRYIEKVTGDAVRKGFRRSAEIMTERIDRIVTHRIFAAPVFLLMMLFIFGLTFGPAGRFLSGGVAFLIANFTGWIKALLEGVRTAPWLVSLVTDGIIAGVGGVLRFLPQIALLFFCLSLLEDSGYMARAAFITDRLLGRFGLSGKAFIPMLMGFGCSVPAVMGARTMENDRDRRMTILLVPFMSCSAKLPVYGLIAAAFFGAWAGLVVFSLYLLGLAAAVASGFIFRKTVFAGETASFVMELPVYRRPTVSNTLIHVWDRVRGFLVRAGTLIFLMSVVLWLLRSFDGQLQIVQNGADSLLARLGTLIAPMFKPQGFPMWQASVALLTGLIAKEAVASSLAMLYGFSLTAGGVAVQSAMTGFTPLAAFSYLVFILLYIPCVAAVTTMYRETNSLRWTAFSAAWQLVVAYVVSMVVYQAGRLMGL